ncbi:hypothetical protein A3H10_04225 [Candidatus Uhrbacteria bacterium RIFCSPLOWO2_12_FULL_46_10]|uniref:Peptidase C39-like domain-containing protein n=1 Tax=Candidatus Uhrbacteria bacterium RIFCSPLOWO2_01_FULL_47_25 TaxID=1802402 RepID=A0A1F7UYP0_9BACT|nr:MAG: hypothetical protein A2752_03490 [Candidatus Uhrbacteria bacterium RIFCSPHIGHO2_01_FULL_46_23]OGL70076.1 MAG: hypothetical protein A3D60_03365 [Candidatus Uhrbacteria bacterium RIFCSPHIGHO2_02_FULL_47_29]OGL75974.1 MAG: hypothetical protein A3E96_01940 [Candidatus Uhrbacteria bacterium RIFCSPHIGHO2_12_FULL_46_13]OGL82837.1 MAG: hypothetical protein A2936_04190 [Candidatus Uhrbacteria bacterium RIFCSPLOWO2_01_FULL_47_25]OGL84007.1 MAG: hypothetical protein A3I37_04695 [Candidatus Uhrbact
MTTKQRTLIAIITLGLLLWGLAKLPLPYTQEKKLNPVNVANTNPQFIQNNTVISQLTNEIKSTISAPAKIVPLKPRPVPFTAQAPFGDWQDPRQQDGCEEASLVMAWHWIEGTTFTKSQALDEILAISAFEEKTIGEWRSTSAEDTAKIFREYYNYNNITVQHDISAEDIKASLIDGNLVLVPTDGRKLGNPYYRQPGPPEHMLVIFDYDEKTDEFVTNDPGTRRGQNYRYKSNVVAQAIVDYPTGHREPNPNPQTAMIIIQPSS